MKQLTDAQWNRLRYLVETAYKRTYSTTGGMTRVKTAKQREIEKAVAEEVVRFATDHCTDAYLAPGGLWQDLQDELTEQGALRQHPYLGIVHKTDDLSLLS